MQADVKKGPATGPTEVRGEVQVHIDKIAQLPRGRYQIRIRERDENLSWIMIEKRKFNVIKRLTRGRYVVAPEPAKAAS